MAHYVTRDEVKAEPDVPDTLDDATVDRLIAQAEAIVEAGLGPWPVDPDTGLKIAQTAVKTWQWDRLKAAVTATAARIHVNPTIFDPRFKSVSGPDFSYSEPVGSVLGSHIRTLLASTGLIVTGARSRP